MLEAVQESAEFKKEDGASDTSKSPMLSTKHSNLIDQSPPSVRRLVKLSEVTEIGGALWKNLRGLAMSKDYKTQDWFAALSAENKLVLEALREAQQS